MLIFSEHQQLLVQRNWEINGRHLFTKNAGEIMPPAQTIYLFSFRIIMVGVVSIFSIKGFS